jgi:hypothetical protein
MHYLAKLFRKEKPYVLGGTQTIEINDKTDGSKSTITYKMPTGSQLMDFSHAQIQDNKYELRKLDKDKISSYDLHESIRRTLFVPFAKKVIVSWTGYVDKDGNEIKDLDVIEKYKPGHLELVCKYAYMTDERVKKKD